MSKVDGAAARLSPLSGLRELGRQAARSPAFGCYLLALALLPIRWLSPIASAQEHGIWTDVFVGLAALLWLVERLRARTLLGSLRPWQLPLALYVGLAALSARVPVPGYGGSRGTVVVIAELAVLATITADFAVDPARRRIIARVIVASSMVTVALAVVGLILFYGRVPSGLVGIYGEQLTPSRLYARVQAGFESPPLLGSFCIFASGIVASKDAALSPRVRRATQIALGLLCAATVSRALVGFLFAVVLRRSAVMRGPWRVIVPITALAASAGILGALTVGRLHVGDPVRPSTISYLVPDPGNRREAFVTSLHTLEHHPLSGVGPGALPGVNAGVQFRPHFTPLNVAATLGLPALAALLVMLWLMWRHRRRPTDVALWSAAAGIGLDGLVQDIDHFRHVWILLGLLGA